MDRSAAVPMGDVNMKSANEIGYKIHLRGKDVVLTKKGTVFRLHSEPTNDAIDQELTVVECVADEVFLKVEADGKVTVTNDLAKATRFRMFQRESVAGAIGLETVRMHPPRWLRHYSWRIRADPQNTGPSFNMDSAFFFEEPKSNRLLASTPGSPKGPAAKRQKPLVDKARIEALERERDEVGVQLKVYKDKYEALRVRYSALKTEIQALTNTS